MRERGGRACGEEVSACAACGSAREGEPDFWTSSGDRWFEEYSGLNWWIKFVEWYASLGLIFAGVG